VAIIPIITFPTDAPGYSTNLLNQTIKGWADETTKDILVNGSTNGVTYVSGATDWSFVTMLSKGENLFEVSALDGDNIQSSVDSLVVSYITDENLNLIVGAPTGITLERSRNTVKISIIENSEPEVMGYNFYGSEEPGGGTKGFTLLNTTLITANDFFKENTIVLSETIDTSGDIRTTNIIEKVVRDYYFSYEHNRVDQPLGTIPLSEANHYVTTAVAFDTIAQKQVESIYSAELGAEPLLLDTAIRDLPARTTVDIQESYINQVLQINPEVDVKPGTVTRDIHINPPSDEFERLYIIQDFMHRSQSFLTLIEFDDPDGNDVSDPVLTTTGKLRLKEALMLSDENADQVQTLIDEAFTKLAGNVNYRRKDAQNAIGQALFYTLKTPTRDSVINAGGIIETISDETTEPVQFEVLTDFILPINDLDNYFNPTTDRYEARLDIRAMDPGDVGNVDASKIRLVVSGIDSVFGVTNPNPTEFGQDIESNNDLAERAILAFVSVDAGTEAGYLATTLGTPNVQRTKIISAGEELMQRDIDPLRLVHTFGKVDIYVQGSLATNYTENFGFTYKTVKGEQALIQSVQFYHFRIYNSNITHTRPVYQVIEVKNVTKQALYDVTGAEILGDGQVIDLDESLQANLAIGLEPTDVIYVSYRYRDSEPYVFSNQPVDSIVSCIGENSGSLTSENIILQKLEDPLKFGNSTSSHDQMTLQYANGVPNGSIKEVVDESHLLFGENQVELERYGVDADTIIVTDESNTTTYQRAIDYLVKPGDMKTLTTIKRTTESTIPNGSRVLVDYEAGENFKVTYAVNTLLHDVQARVDKMRHLTADVVVKSALKSYIDFDIKVMLMEGSDQTSIDRQIRTAVAKLLSEKLIGQSVYQSDVIHVIEGIIGVDYIVVPFTKMVKANGSLVIKEEYSDDWEEYQTVNVTTFKSVGVLQWKTTEGGGPDTAFRGVFENDIELALVDDLSKVSEAAGRAFISSIGHIFVSPKLGNIHEATVSTTYLVEEATGSRDINFSDIEYGAVGDLIITYDFSKAFTGF